MKPFGQTSTQLRRGPAKVLEFPVPQTRKLIVPREHGSWGLWLLPLVTGAILGAVRGAGASPATLAPLFWFFVASASAFLAYQPLEVLLGLSPIKARSRLEQQIAASWVLLAGTAGAISAFELIRLARGRVLLLALLGIACFAIRMRLGKTRAFRIVKQILGALSLSSAAAGAYYVTAGKFDRTALLLWAANWLFASAQIEYVQMRMRTVGARTRAEKLNSAMGVYGLHIALAGIAFGAFLAALVPALVAIAFLPAIARLIVWTASEPVKIDFHLLGFSELFQSVLFSSLLLCGFLLPL